MRKASKRRITIVIALLITVALSIVAVSVFAHSGGTDGSGGHYDRSTGEYHYHHGYSAHQHYDMDGDGDRDCPYNFKDATNHSSSGGGTSSSSKPSSSSNSNTNSSSSSKYKPSTVKNNTSTNSDREDKELRAFWWVTIILAVAAVVIIALIKSNDNGTISELKANIYRKDAEIKKLKDKIETTEKEIAEAMSYANKSIYDITSIPKSVEISTDGTPKIQSVFVTGDSPKTVHCRPRCHMNTLYMRNFFEVAHLQPCSFCASREIKTFRSWFPDYAEKLKFLAKHNVPIVEHIDYDKLSNIIKNHHWYCRSSHHPRLNYSKSFFKNY